MLRKLNTKIIDLICLAIVSSTALRHKLNQLPIP